jgi:hypothetical protein
MQVGRAQKQRADTQRRCDLRQRIDRLLDLGLRHQ